MDTCILILVEDLECGPLPHHTALQAGSASHDLERNARKSMMTSHGMPASFKHFLRGFGKRVFPRGLLGLLGLLERKLATFALGSLFPLDVIESPLSFLLLLALGLSQCTLARLSLVLLGHRHSPQLKVSETPTLHFRNQPRILARDNHELHLLQ